jgi:ABC-2 type transport system permease protein
VIEDGLDRAGGLLARFEALDAELLVSPFTGRVQRVSGDAVRLTDFYAPAVLVLLVQHMVVTFIGLSVVREEELGTTELFRVAPVSVGEILLGKTLAYLLLGGVVAAVLVGLLVVGLGVPMLGSWPLLAVGVAAALLAAIGLAFVVALAARSDSQAVQYAMLVLLASIFFSGFILSLDRFVPAVTFLASALPATHAIRLLRGIMLRGSAMPAVLVATLAGFAAVLLAVSWAMLRRRLARG